LQILSQGKVGWYYDKLIFDIHAITELRDQGVLPTDDSPKYNYHAKSENKAAEYGKSVLQLCNISGF
jgi:hypothetical protein